MEIVSTEQNGLSFSEDWFSRHKGLWEGLIDYKRPQRILEIGSFEGLSTSYIIEQASKFNELSICCVDTWQGGEEHEGIDFVSVEDRFDKNMKIAMDAASNPVELCKVKTESYKALAQLIANDFQFDLIYIDGSHMAADVLSDAVMAFRLLRVGGTMIFDDYAIVDRDTDPLHHPQIAINTFMSIYKKQMEGITFSSRNNDTGEIVNIEGLYQLYTTKVAE